MRRGDAEATLTSEGDGGGVCVCEETEESDDFKESTAMKTGHVLSALTFSPSVRF